MGFSLSVPKIGRASALLGLVCIAAPVVALAADNQLPAGVASVASSLTANGGHSMMASGARMFGGLLLCLGFLAAGVKLYQRFNPAAVVGRARRLEVRERVAISSKSSLTLVALDGKEFLVASGSDAVTIIPTKSKADDLFDQSLGEIYKEGEVCDAQ